MDGKRESAHLSGLVVNHADRYQCNDVHSKAFVAEHHAVSIKPIKARRAIESKVDKWCDVEQG